jgi:hypothetical protein
MLPDVEQRHLTGPPLAEEAADHEQREQGDQHRAGGTPADAGGSTEKLHRDSPRPRFGFASRETTLPRECLVTE